jgi:hypothetical protein
MTQEEKRGEKMSANKDANAESEDMTKFITLEEYFETKELEVMNSTIEAHKRLSKSVTAIDVKNYIRLTYMILRLLSRLRK